MRPNMVRSSNTEVCVITVLPCMCLLSHTQGGNKVYGDYPWSFSKVPLGWNLKGLIIFGSIIIS